MLNISLRQKTPFREKMGLLKEVNSQIENCKKCNLCKHRQNALSGKLVEPSDVVVVDWMPTDVEDKDGALLAGGRDKGLDKLFSLSKPTLDVTRMSFLTAYKCFGSVVPDSDVCLSYLSEQLKIFDPILVLVFGQKTLDLVSGKQNLQLGVPYSTGTENQFLLFGLLHPKEVVADKARLIPVWKIQLAEVSSLVTQYDLKILK